MENLPIAIGLLFGLTTFLTVGLFYLAAHRSKTTLIVLLAWLALQTAIGLSGFYEIKDTVPPRFLLLVGPPMLFVVLLFCTHKGRAYLDSLDLPRLMLLHVIRIPVEIVLFMLFLHKAIPEVMTFEGRNLDILSGLSAPIIWYFAYSRKTLGKTGLLIWNFFCLGLLINIVTHAILSAPFRFQQMAFDQPNEAIFHFPFIWLPCCVVPLVLLAHLAAIRRLLRR